MVPLQFRIQGLLLGAALGELYSTGLLDKAPMPLSRSTAPIQLPHTQHLLQTVRVELQTPEVPWALITTPSEEGLLYLNAVVFPLLYPGSPQQLLSDWSTIAPQDCAIALQTAIALSYSVAVALHSPTTFPTLLHQSLPFQPHPWLETLYRSLWRTPTDYKTSLQLTQRQSPTDSLALTLTGALSGGLNTVTDFPLGWLATLTEQPYLPLGETSWSEAIHSLSIQCLARWSGKLQSPPGGAVDPHTWSSVAIASANQFRPR